MRHRFLAIASAALALLGTGAAASAQTGPSASARGGVPSIEPFLRIRTPSGPQFLADGSLVVRDWPDGVWQAYRVVAGRDASGNESFAPGVAAFTRLTDFPDGVQRVAVSPDGKRVVVHHAPGGNENAQLSLLDPHAPPGRNLTPILADPKVQASLNEWLRDGSGFLYSANADSPTDFHLYRWDFTTATATRVLAEAGSWAVSDVSLDGRRALVSRSVSASDTRCFELELASGRLREITLRPQGGTAACDIVGYLPGERAVLMTSDWKDGMLRLYERDLASGRAREPLPALTAFELDEARLNDARDLLVVSTNEDGYGVFHVYAVPGYAELPAPTQERGVGGASSFTGRTLVWSLSNARRTGASFATTYPPARSKALPVTRQVTWTDDQGLDLGAFRLPEVVRYPASDGRSIPALLYLPASHTPGTAVPFVLWYHGGPEGQSRPSFNAQVQYLLTLGFGILMPNVRGSTGYGREFQMLDDYTRRWDSVRDGVDAAEWLVRQGHATPGRMATYGGSYGGFMSVACLVEDAERVERGTRKERLFGAGVNIVGIVNLRTFLEKTSGYRRALREVEYGPLADTTFLASVSSIHRVDKLQVPMFIAHGFNDPRVPVEEAMQLAVALKDRGRRPRVFIAPDEGHGFQKLDNRIYFNERAAQFLLETIGRK
jgi:dipeptidyl aminopeptidase/acylaminoacyl peptidase